MSQFAADHLLPTWGQSEGSLTSNSWFGLGNVTALYSIGAVFGNFQTSHRSRLASGALCHRDTFRQAIFQSHTVMSSLQTILEAGKYDELTEDQVNNSFHYNSAC